MLKPVNGDGEKEANKQKLWEKLREGAEKVIQIEAQRFQGSKVKSITDHAIAAEGRKVEKASYEENGRRTEKASFEETQNRNYTTETSISEPKFTFFSISESQLLIYGVIL